MSEVKRRNERLIVLLVIGAIALNYPLLSLFSTVRLLFGIPVLYLYIFAAWFLLILCIALILDGRGSPPLRASPPPPKGQD